MNFLYFFAECKLIWLVQFIVLIWFQLFCCSLRKNSFLISIGPVCLLFFCFKTNKKTRFIVTCFQTQFYKLKNMIELFLFCFIPFCSQSKEKHGEQRIGILYFGFSSTPSLSLEPDIYHLLVATFVLLNTILLGMLQVSVRAWLCWQCWFVAAVLCLHFAGFKNLIVGWCMTFGL